MTELGVSRATGYKVSQISSYPGDKRLWFAAFKDDGTKVAENGHAQAKVALAGLLGKIYQDYSRQCLERAKWVCENCGKYGPLQIHHVKFRSHGRRDHLSNLKALCGCCHRIAHGGH